MDIWKTLDAKVGERFQNTSHLTVYERVDGTVGGAPAFVEVRNGKKMRRKISLFDLNMVKLDVK
jgi:hypothetical protein